MKKKADDELRSEYPSEFFTDMKPNRFAGKELQFKRSIILDADVAEVFESSEAVNTVLRSAIRAMRAAAPKTSKGSAKRPAS